METQPASDDLDLHALLFKLTTRWPLFLLALTLAGGGAWLYLQVKQPVYAFRATMLLGDQRTGSKQVQELLQLLQMRDESRPLEDEVGVLASSDFGRQTVAQLPYAVRYYTVPAGWLNRLRPLQVREAAVGAAPFRVWADLTRPQLTGVAVHVEPAGPGQCRVWATAAAGGNLYYLASGQPAGHADRVVFNRTLAWGDTLNTKLLRIVLTPEPGYDLAGQTAGWYFVLNDLGAAAAQYQSSLVVRATAQESRIIEFTVKDVVPARGVAFLNALMSRYLAADLAAKNETGQKTLAFLDQEIDKLRDSRRQAAGALARFRTARGVLDVTAQSVSGVQRMGGLETTRAQVATRRKYYQSMLAYLRANRQAGQVASPISAGINDQVLNNLILQLAGLNEKRAEVGVTASGDNPLLTVLDGRIRQTKESLIQTVSNLSQANDIDLRDVSGQLGQVRGQMSRMPEDERQLSALQSANDFNEKNYNFLINKRNEAAIALATNATSNKVVDPAQLAGSGPEAPQPQLVVLLALLAGLVLPAGLVLLRDKSNRRVQSRDDLAQVTSIPLLGVIAHGTSAGKKAMMHEGSGPVAESFRSIRVNLQYLGPGPDKKVLGVTSSVQGEGKTFCAVNLAVSLAQAGCRVMLVETDLRRPTVAGYFGLAADPGHGLASYLNDQSTLAEAKRPTGVPGLDVLSCGAIPPNATQLLERPRMAALITQLREEYDYVVLDTPPVGLVAEYFVLMRLLDANIYVVRHNYTERSLLSQMDELYRSKRIRQLYILINDMHFKEVYEYRYTQNKEYAHGY